MCVNNFHRILFAFGYGYSWIGLKIQYEYNLLFKLLSVFMCMEYLSIFDEAYTVITVSQNTHVK
jgi:hypothetical protein